MDEAKHPRRRGPARLANPKRVVSITLSDDVLIALESHLGSLSRSAYIEQAIRRQPEIAQHLQQQRP